MQKKLTVLLSAYACGPNHGSEPEVGWQNAVHLSKYCNVKVITQSAFKIQIEKELSKLNIKNIQFIYFDLPKFLNFVREIQPLGMTIHYHLWQYFIYKFVKRNRIHKKVDLIHHITFCQFIFPGFWYKLNIPYILNVGGTAFVPNQFYSLLNFNERLGERLRKTVKEYFKKNQVLINYFKNAKKILFANGSIAKEFEHVPSFIMLETGISRSLIQKKSYLNKEKLKMIWVGGLIYRKGFILLLKAMNKLRGYNIHLDVYGSGKKMDEYKRYIRRHNLTSNINLKGNIPHEIIIEKYRHYDLFVFTSLRDTSGNVVLEAMAAGLSVICLNHQGVKDIMNGANCGIAIEPKNPKYAVDKIAEAIMFYKNNQDKIKEHGLNAQKRLMDKYTWEKKAQTIYKIYKEALEID